MPATYSVVGTSTQPGPRRGRPLASDRAYSLSRYARSGTPRFQSVPASPPTPSRN
jgi:hypothetical protein